VVTVLLARELVAQGAKVLVVDLDPQKVGISIRLGADVDSPLAYTAVDLVLGSRGRAFLPQSLVNGRLDVIASNQRDLAGLERHLSVLHEERRLTMGPNPRRGVLEARLKGVESAYDFVLIDTPTGFGEITTNALEAAHLVVSPIDMKSADNVESVTDLLEHMEELSRQPPVVFVLNKWVKAEKQCRTAMARARELCGDRLLADALLPESTAVPKAMTERRDIAPTSETAVMLRESVWKLGQRVMQMARPDTAAAVVGA
jgi:cellulose biosynthesis protein BcsQ